MTKYFLTEDDPTPRNVFISLILLRVCPFRMSTLDAATTPGQRTSTATGPRQQCRILAKRNPHFSTYGTVVCRLVASTHGVARAFNDKRSAFRLRLFDLRPQPSSRKPSCVRRYPARRRPSNQDNRGCATESRDSSSPVTERAHHKQRSRWQRSGWDRRRVREMGEPCAPSEAEARARPGFLGDERLPGVGGIPR